MEQNFMFALQLGYSMFMVNRVQEALRMVWDHIVDSFEIAYAALNEIGLLDENGALVNAPSDHHRV